MFSAFELNDTQIWPGFQGFKTNEFEHNQSKLEKGLYKRAHEFAEDITIMLSHAATCHHHNNGIHKTAIKFRGDFDVKWKSLKEEWKVYKPSTKPTSEVSEHKKKDLVSEDEYRGIKRNFLDTILASQDILIDFGQKEKVERRKKEREGIEKIERTVWINENIKAFEELERLCGHSLWYDIGK